MQFSLKKSPAMWKKGKPEMATPLPSSQLSQIWTMRRSATALRWVSMAPLGLPVVPPVYWMYAMASRVTSPTARESLSWYFISSAERSGETPETTHPALRIPSQAMTYSGMLGG